MYFDTFDKVVSYMEHFTNLEKENRNYNVRTYRLDRMAALLDHFNNPEKSFKTIHVAGSKGKGSTASMIASALTADGFTTGLFLSPHLIDYRERFLINMRFAPESLLLETGEILKEGVDRFSFTDEIGPTKPTTFELYTTFAFLLYREAGCRWAVIETGLGGRLDATNTITPEACVICPIEMEHTRILGDTLEKIAAEKSKIIKPGTPVFIGYEKREAMEVLTREAEAQHAPLYSLADELEKVSSATTKPGERVSLIWRDGTEEKLCLSMRGSVQAHNCALALLTLRKLNLYSPTSRKAIEADTLPARFEKVHSLPDIYLDGAHTVNSLTGMSCSLKELEPEKENRIAIYGALEDKNHESMCEVISDTFSRVIISTPGTYKRSDISKIHAIFKARHPEIRCSLIPDNREALEEAKKEAGADKTIMVCGSFYLAGEIAQLIKNENKSSVKGIVERACV